MKTEISAGGVIIRKTAGGSWEVLLIRDMNDQWTFPKGLIEEGETPEGAAKREIGEEVGVRDIKFLAPLGTVGYTYRRNGLINKTVHYFLFMTSGNDKPVVQKEEGISEARWMLLSEASVHIGYPETNNILLLQAADNAAKIASRCSN